MAAKPDTTTASTQYSVEDTKITESTKVIISRIKRKTTNQLTTSRPSSENTNVNQKPNQASTNSRNQRYTASSRVQKGVDDPIKEHNRFGALMGDESMDMDEVGQRHSARGRPRSPIKAPQK